MNRRREIGTAAAFTRDGSFYIFYPTEYSELKAAWMAGKAFYTGKDLFGDEVTVKLAVVEAVKLFTPGGIAASMEEEAADRRDDAITGAE